MFLFQHSSIWVWDANPAGKWYYTIIDFNEVDMRIYLPEKVIFTGHKAEVNITFKGR